MISPLRIISYARRLDGSSMAVVKVWPESEGRSFFRVFSLSVRM